jgi:hypothetical protein
VAWTRPAAAGYLATVDDPTDSTKYDTVIEVAHGDVALTVTAREARDLASALRHDADQISEATVSTVTASCFSIATSRLT